MSGPYHVHLISDATGETLHGVARAALAQFESVAVQEHSYTLVRSQRQLQRAVDYIREHPGLVLFTIVNQELRNELLMQCGLMAVPHFDVMEGPVGLMQQFFNAPKTQRPGGQHDIDQKYLQRIEALNYTIEHDDGSNLDLGSAEVILVGASRTSKTPTCVYLAIRGIRAANVPLVLGMAPPSQLLTFTTPLIVGLWAAPERLVQIRRNRLQTMGEEQETEYVDLEKVRGEVMATRRLYEQQGWPSIDVTRRSIEETAAQIMTFLAERRGETA
ncbi:MAG TPA: pyruvate, water dikinase regulatory protein [Rhizomicrobium sp.]|nr:pyruvate, water dikinase regulatory protein [Rhizomicrobium sp.]